jgi:hypothetical protein
MAGKSGLKVLTLSASDMVRQMEGAVQFGQPVLLADIMEEIDPVLERLLAKAYIRLTWLSWLPPVISMHISAGGAQSAW